MDVDRGDEHPAPCVVNSHHETTRRSRRQYGDPTKHLLSVAESGRDHQTWSGRLAGIEEAKP
jgi:hypothetical protein